MSEGRTRTSKSGGARRAEAAAAERQAVLLCAALDAAVDHLAGLSGLLLSGLPDILRSAGACAAVERLRGIVRRAEDAERASREGIRPDRRQDRVLADRLLGEALALRTLSQRDRLRPGDEVGELADWLKSEPRRRRA